MSELATATGELITEPGVYTIPDTAYHADPVPGGSLSSSGARKLMPPGCPALFQHWRTEGQPPKAAFDLGHAAHMLVLGTGPELAVVDADGWRTKAARAERDAAHERGATPLLRDDHARVQAMATALREHPIAAVLFRPDAGRPEQSLFWVDDDTGVWRRARLDWLPHRGDGRLIIPDYKTCRSAAPEQIERSIHTYGYHQQGAWYTDGAQALDLGDDPAFLLVFQETDPPHLVNVVQPDPTALRIGRNLNRQALGTYRECTATGTWPSYSNDIELIGLPAWVERRHLEEIW